MGSSEGKSNLLRGAFVSEEIKDSIPVFSTPVRLPPRQAWFTNINCITLKYRTNGTSVRGLIPDNLTIEKEPLVTSMLLDYGMSNFGQYHELIYFLEGVHQAQKYDYGIVLYLDNEDAVYGGREGFGYPKILAKLDVQFRPECMKAYMRDRVERPTDMPILDIMFKPSLLLEEFEVPETTKHHLNLRVILTVAEQIQDLFWVLIPPEDLLRLLKIALVFKLARRVGQSLRELNIFMEKPSRHKKLANMTRFRRLKKLRLPSAR